MSATVASARRAPWQAFDREERDRIVKEMGHVDLVVASPDRELAACLAKRLGENTVQFLWDSAATAKECARLWPDMVVLDGRRVTEEAHPLLLVPAISRACDAWVVVVTDRPSRKLDKMAAHLNVYDVVHGSGELLVSGIVGALNLLRKSRSAGRRIPVVH